jgi:hypothetical protein
MSTDDGKTHYVGDGCQPAHDPRIDQTPTDARVAAEAYRRASTGTGPVSFEELHAEYLVEIDAKVRAEKEVARLQRDVEELTHILDTHRVTYPDRLGHWACEPEVERLRAIITECGCDCGTDELRRAL